jgi:hypothetical protein
MPDTPQYGTAYDPRKNIVTVGIETIQGFVKGSSIKVEYVDTERVSAESGLDGAVVFTLNPSRLAKMTLNLQAMSRSNAYLNRLMNLASQGSAAAFVSAEVKDLTQQRQAGGSRAILGVKPPLESSETAGGNEWVIWIADCTIDHQGDAVPA